MQSQKSHPAEKTFLAIALLLVLATSAQFAQAQTYKFKVLHTFHGKDGAFPFGQLARDAQGNFYSTTGEGGIHTCVDVGCGTVFKMAKTGKLIWSYSFDGKNGFDPVAGVLRDAAGNLYGTTEYGGTVPTSSNFGDGVVFKLDPSRKETVLHRYKGCNVNGPHDGLYPRALLVMDASGMLYGTTLFGGVPSQCQGTAFAMTKAGKQTILHRFSGGTDGGGPSDGLILGGVDSLFGVTSSGGTFNNGAGFQLGTKGGETVLYSFMGGADGGFPVSILVADAAGNLYGTTLMDSSGNCGGQCGTVFELSPGSNGWTQKTLYTFCQKSLCADGEMPLYGPLVLDNMGNIYGATNYGGYSNGGLCRSGCGVVYKLDPSGTETVLYTFKGGPDGAFPASGLFLDGKGNLYGTATGGGDFKCFSDGCGVVFELSP